MDGPVQPPEMIVYSTGVNTAIGADGHKYFVKGGPDVETAFAELAGCLLARMVGLVVPDVAVGRFQGESYAASREVATISRNIKPWLSKPEKVVNQPHLYSAIVVDIWLANQDRNIGNVIGRSMGGGKVELVMIDFEKSCALRRNPTTTSAGVTPKQLWPTGELGAFARAGKPLHAPARTIGNIRSLTKDDVAQVLTSTCAACGRVDWLENSIHAVVSRAAAIDNLVSAVWEQN